MNIWLIIIGLAAGTFIIRISFIALFGTWEIPPLLHRALRFVPVSVLFPLIVPQFLTQNNTLNVSLSNPRLIAGLVAGLVAWRTKNVVLTILSGMIVLWLLKALYPTS